MSFDKGFLILKFNNEYKNLKIWERILMNLYIVGGYAEPIKLTDIVELCYKRNLTPYERMYFYGTVWRIAEKLRANGNLIRYNNPVSYKLSYNKDTANYLKTIARKLGFENARAEDFL